MFKRIALTLALALPLLAAEAPLTNDDVVKLSKAGLSADTIVAKIGASETKFDTSADALVSLANAGVADGVIRAMVEKKPVVAPRRTEKKQPAKRRRFEEVSVAAAGGGRCEHATLELTGEGLKTTGCHETDVDVPWKDVAHVCPLYAFRSTLVIATAAGERRLYLGTPAELKAVAEAVRAFAPAVRETTSCR